MAEKRFPLVPVLVLGGALLYAAYLLSHVLVPFVLSCALAYILNPVVKFFEVRGLRRTVTVILLYLAGAFLISLVANRLVEITASELASLKSEAPVYLARSKQYLLALQKKAAQRLPYGAAIVKSWDPAKLAAPLVEGAQNLPGYLLGIFPLLSLLFLIPFITFFLLLDGRGMIDFFIQSCPSRYVEQALHLISEIDASLGNYLRGIVIVAAAIAAASFVGLVMMDVNGAIAIAALSGVSSFVPYLGAIVGAVVGGLAAAFQFGTPAAGLKVVMLFLGIRLADEAFLQPFIARYSVHLHPLVFLLALLIGGEMFGFLGLVFAVPAACILKSLVKVSWAWYATQARLKGPDTAEAVAIPYT